MDQSGARCMRVNIPRAPCGRGVSQVFKNKLLNSLDFLLAWGSVISGCSFLFEATFFFGESAADVGLLDFILDDSDSFVDLPDSDLSMNE